MEKRSRSDVLVIVFAVLLLGAFAGGLAMGHSFGKSSGYVAPAISGTPARGKCPLELPDDKAHLLAGLTCPGEKCDSRPVVKCHCQVAHGVKSMIKGMLAAGKSDSQCRAAAAEFLGGME